MTHTSLAATVFGLALGLAVAFGGWNAFLVVLVFGAAGMFVGRVLEGAIDLSDYVGGRNSSRSAR